MGKATSLPFVKNLRFDIAKSCTLTQKGQEAFSEMNRLVPMELDLQSIRKYNFTVYLFSSSVSKYFYCISLYSFGFFPKCVCFIKHHGIKHKSLDKSCWVGFVQSEGTMPPIGQHTSQCPRHHLESA